MPLYRHTCPGCHITIEDFRPLSQMKELPPCDGCGKPMPRDITGEARGGNAAFHTPIELFSIAPETQEQHDALVLAGAEFREGVPLAHDRPEKMRLLKAAGFTEMN